MAGIKHHLQQFGQPITNEFNKIENPFERHAAYMTQQVQVYCKGCGKLIIESDKDEHNNKVDYRTEQARKMCTKCYNLEQEALRKQAQAMRQQQAPKEINWEEYIKQHMRE